MPLILDGGACAVGLESTVLFVAEPQPVLLRAGGIPLEEIEAMIGPVRHAAPVEDRPQSPGQLKHHYAPRKPLRLVRRHRENSVAGGCRLARFRAADRFLFSAVIENISPTGNLREAAANFFRALRSLDDDPRVATLYAMPLPAEGLGLAINERLERRSGLIHAGVA